MQEVIFDIVKNVYAAPTQKPTIYDIQEVFSSPGRMSSFVFLMLTYFLRLLSHIKKFILLRI
ncbi:hypothetical protein KSP39_PZI018999 [Platanthera zijinensis]|uniref:Uncharacterized protein n=1 Tax=Platanthera zijinensis TaxID=2320716 RepID=A0AAP0B579_9ASPA